MADAPTHVHRFRVETPNGPLVRAECACGVRREYLTAGLDSADVRDREAARDRARRWNQREPGR